MGSLEKTLLILYPSLFTSLRGFKMLSMQDFFKNTNYFKKKKKINNARIFG